MKKFIAFILGLLLVFSGCSQEEPADKYEEEYSGVIKDIFTEGAGSDIANVIEVETESGDKIYFTVTDESRIIRYLEDVNERIAMALDEVEIGSRVEVSCQSYENSDYHPIVEIKIIQKKLR